MENYQDILFPYAYNILGSVEDSKDAIQDVLTKHLSIEKSHIENDIGYLIKSVINRSINIKKRNSKITANKVWLPEPIATEKADGNIDREEIISYSMLVLLEKLTAQERAVFILKEAFDYSHKDIANTIVLSIENSRKLLSRAKTKLTNYREEGYKDYSANQVAFIEKYIQTIKKGDVKGLEQILSDDISLSADGGENIKVVRELTVGKSATLKLLFYVFKTYLELLSVKITHINHQPALLFYEGDTLVNCQVFELEEGKVKQIFAIIDPLKLKLLF